VSGNHSYARPERINGLFGHRAAAVRLFFADSHAKIFEAVRNRTARFFLVQNTKTGKNIPNGHKILIMAVK
jgi:hypothetical protein